MNSHKKECGIYIHIPFCRKKCNYCDFVSADYGNKTADYIDKYLKALIKEIDLSVPATLYPLPSTLYIGGGTPSILSEKQIHFLFEGLFSYLPKLENAEITFEANPESVTEEKLKILKSYGVNRLSIGAQSFDDGLLRFLGRIHTKNDFLAAFRSARKTGFDNINIDLIFGIPGQTLKNWQTALEYALRLKPEHISVYGLTVEEGTVFHKDGVVADDDLSADMYEFAIKYLKQNGYRHYEISNFAKPGFECRHNMNYWKNGRYFGFGLGAVSHLNGRRIKNTEDFEDYLEGKYHAGCEELAHSEKIAESIILGLRFIEGIEINDDTLRIFSPQIENLKKNNLLEKQNNLLKLTDRGIMLANCVFSEFL